jgi:hypothetical protein
VGKINFDAARRLGLFKKSNSAHYGSYAVMASAINSGAIASKKQLKLSLQNVWDLDL